VLLTGGRRAKPFVVLVGGRARREFDSARSLGYEVVYLEHDPPLDCLMWADLPINVRLDDWSNVLSALRGHVGEDNPPAAVLTHVEPHVPLMASLRESLGLAARDFPLEVAWNCRDKWRTRKCLEDKGIPSPRYSLAMTVTEAEVAAERIGYPVVVKPRAGAGGLGVRLCGSLNELRAGWELAVESNDGRLPGALVEEYIDGPEYAVQAVTMGGRTEVVSVFAQTVSEPPAFVELGYDYPSGLGVAELTALDRLVADALAAIGLTNWVSHTQVRRDASGFKVVEINARRPGGRLVDMTEAVSGIDLVRAATELALGRPVSGGTPVATHAGYRSLTFDQAGKLFYETSLALDDLESPISPIVEIDVPPGHPVLPAADPGGGVYGRILVCGDSNELVRRDLKAIEQALDLTVVPTSVDTARALDVREFKPCC
jgi:biotin carboxylase